MSKKMMKRTAALSALIAVALSGTVMAAELNGSNKEYVGKYDSPTGAGNNVTIAGTGSETVTFTGSTTEYINGAFRAGTTTGSTLKDIDTIIVNNGWDNVFLTNGSGVMTIENVKNIISTETTSNAPYRIRFFHALGGTLNVGTDVQGVGSINLKNVGNAFYAQTVKGKNGTINVNAESIYIESYSGAVIGATDFNDSSTDCKSTVSITADNVTIKALNGTALSAISGTIYQDPDTKKWITDTDSAGVNHEDNSITITSDLLDIEAKDAVIAKNGSTNGVSVSLNSKNIVIKAENDAVLAKDKANVNIGGGNNFDKADITGNIASSDESSVDVKLGNGGSLTGSVITGTENGDTSTTSLDLGTDSTWTATGNSNVTTLEGQDGNIKVDMTEEGKIAQVAIGTNNAMGTEVSGTGAVSDYLAANGDEAAAEFANSVTDANGAIDDTVTTDEGLIGGAYTLTRNADGSVSVAQAINTKSDAVSNASMNLKAHFRAHMNDMNKRMGELRMANGETGAWARMVRGEYEYQGAKSQHNQYQFGYDKKLASDDRWTVGAAITVSEGNGSYGQGYTEDNSRSFAVYGSKLNDDGTFVDLIARYINMDSDVADSVYGDGDYDTNGYSVSAEVGKRIEQKGFWIEPQAELTYGSVDSASILLGNQYKANFGSMDSLIARLGFSLGKDIKQGNIYARASYLYDFDGESTTQFNGGKMITEDFGGGWWEVGIGTNFQVSDATYIYADVEKTFGGELDTNWQWNLGVRYSF